MPLEKEKTEKKKKKPDDQFFGNVKTKLFGGNMSFSHQHLNDKWLKTRKNDKSFYSSSVVLEFSMAAEDPRAVDQ